VSLDLLGEHLNQFTGVQRIDGRIWVNGRPPNLFSLDDIEGKTRRSPDHHPIAMPTFQGGGPAARPGEEEQLARLLATGEEAAGESPWSDARRNHET
jgi:hypothetical protein